MRRIAIIAAAVLVLVSCGGRAKKAGDQEQTARPFPEVSVPSMYSDEAEALDYITTHFWDKFFECEGTTDATHILGVRRDEVGKHLAEYLTYLDPLPVSTVQKRIGGLFSAVDAKQTAMSDSSLFYLRFTELVARYLYDPNSPYRNEDYFLPFVQGLAASPNTRDDLRPGYEYQARMCAINQHGWKAPDFQFKDAKGRTHHLYEVRADYTMLFFSNPGCEACLGIIGDVQSRPYVDPFIAEGRLAVVNIYIDEDIAAWKAYEPTYPRNWLTGYDHLYRIREEQIYDVRAIPSLYLLDKEFKIVMKDAPIERVLGFLDSLARNQN